jgi:hypothetical protein
MGLGLGSPGTGCTVVKGGTIEGGGPWAIVVVAEVSVSVVVVDEVEVLLTVVVLVVEVVVGVVETVVVVVEVVGGTSSTGARYFHFVVR